MSKLIIQQKDRITKIENFFDCDLIIYRVKKSFWTKLFKVKKSHAILIIKAGHTFVYEYEIDLKQVEFKLGKL